MGLMDMILGASGTLPAGPDPWGGISRPFLFENGVKTFSGRRVTYDRSMTVSTVYAGINLLSKSVAVTPINMYRIDPLTQEMTVTTSHPLADLLATTPNNWQTAFDFKAMMQMHLSLRGNGYAEILPGPRGAVDQLQPIHPDRVRVSRASDGTCLYRVSDPATNQTRVLTQDEMFHIRSPIAPGGLVGVSPIDYAIQTIGLALAAEEHGARMFSNGARPNMAISLKNRLSDAAFARYKEDINANFAGNENAHRTMVLEEGATVTPISLSADQLQFLMTRNFQVEEVARFLDVPLILLHHASAGTSFGTGLETVMIAFVRNNLMPWLVAWQQAITRDLITAPGLYTAQFDTQAMQRGDSAALANYYSRLCLNGILTRNEARKALGYNPIPGLDAPLTPSNTTTNDGMPGNGSTPSESNALIGHNGGPPLEAILELEESK